jgi:hypothetical protein
MRARTDRLAVGSHQAAALGRAVASIWRRHFARAIVSAAVLGLLAARYEAATSSRASIRLNGTEMCGAAAAPRTQDLPTRYKAIGLSRTAAEAATSYDVLHSFSAESGFPQANLLQGTDGKLYGTATRGGVGRGSVFVLTPTGTGGFDFATLHSFTNSDGAYPYAGLIQAADGDFYGTTSAGGACGCGTSSNNEAYGCVTGVL